MFAGTLNLGAALTIRAAATGDATLLAECVRLIEAAEARRGRFVVLADRVARRYAPAVHLCALADVPVVVLRGRRAGWPGAADRERGADHHLPMRAGVGGAGGTGNRHRSAVPRRHPAEIATALERLAEVDTVVFDKTGTLTEPLLALLASDQH